MNLAPIIRSTVNLSHDKIKLSFSHRILKSKQFSIWSLIFYIYVYFLGPPPLCEGETGHQSEPKCTMCMNLNNDPVSLWQCGRNHYYCKSCKDLLDSAGICPQCQADGLPRGNQPVGSMTWMSVPDSSLPGYDDCGIIAMHFHFLNGIQGTSLYIYLVGGGTYS